MIRLARAKHPQVVTDVRASEVVENIPHETFRLSFAILLRTEQPSHARPDLITLIDNSCKKAEAPVDTSALDCSINPLHNATVWKQSASEALVTSAKVKIILGDVHTSCIIVTATPVHHLLKFKTLLSTLLKSSLNAEKPRKSYKRPCSHPAHVHVHRQPQHQSS